MFTTEKIDASKTALVIIDLQRGYCDPTSDLFTKLGWDTHDAELVCRAHQPFLEKIREVLPPERIIWFQMEEHPSTTPQNLTFCNGKLCEEEALCVRGTEGHDFHIVGPCPGEAVFQKFHYNCFAVQEFRDYLQVQGIQQLSFTGVIGSRCVNSTIISAAERGFECIALTNLIGGPARFKDEIRIHMQVTTSLFAIPMLSDDFMNRLK